MYTYECVKDRERERGKEREKLWMRSDDKKIGSVENFPGVTDVG